jgi:hypothetical protein
MAKNAGCSPGACDTIKSMVLARELWTLMLKSDADLFFPKLLEMCLQHCRKAYPHGKITIILVSENDTATYSLVSD